MTLKPRGKAARLTLAEFPKWLGLCCWLFKRELYIVNIFGGFFNLAKFSWPEAFVVQLREICYLIEGKTLNLQVFQSFVQIKKLLVLHSLNLLIQ
jgi:hypothetical protein